MPALRSFVLLPVFAVLFASVPARAADEGNVGTAVKKGAEFLDAAFTKGGDDTHRIGGAALGGIALLESGIKPESPGLANIIKVLREEALASTETYNVALCVLFFDKLMEKTGDKTDEGIIQALGVRLYAGMNVNGGWGYSTWDAVNPQELVRMAEALKKNELVGTKKEEKPAAPKKDDGFIQPGKTPSAGSTGAAANIKMHGEATRQLLNVQQVLRARGRNNTGADDNSNTQFGLIGLWVASRHGLPAADAFALIEARFLQTQNQQDAGWGYTNSFGDAGALLRAGSSTPAMTCAGLLGLAVGAGSRNALIAEANKAKPEPEKPAGDDPFSNPKPKTPPKQAGGAIKGKAAEAALTTLGKFLATTKPGAGDLKNFVGSGNILYMLWSIERVAMAYGLDTIGDIDWFDWGCGYLLTAQAQDGSWDDGSYGKIVNTSFALLFLTKSNSVRDLSNKIKGKVRDPGKSELRAGAGANAPLFAPPPKEGSKPQPMLDPKTTAPAFSLPPVLSPNDEAEIQKVSAELAGATDETWKSKLEAARDAKGSKWTRGLVAACAQLEAERKQQAREALAERLTRMTAKTLREMLADPDAELRRAACLAAGMKEDKLLIPALIERITDPSEIVVRAAKASLKSISQADYGPPNGADDEAKLKAAATWKSWYEALPK